MSDQEELIDIVNKKGKVIGTATRAEAHEKGLLHKTVLAQVHDSKGNWILIRQSADRQDPGMHVSPMGGHVDSGETDDDAMRRETAEELGITNFAYTRLGTFIFDRHVLGRHENHYFIVYRIDSDQPFTINHEIESYTTFSEADLKRAMKETPERFGPTLFLVARHFYPHIHP